MYALIRISRLLVFLSSLIFLLSLHFLLLLVILPEIAVFSHKGCNLLFSSDAFPFLLIFFDLPVLFLPLDFDNSFLLPDFFPWHVFQCYLCSLLKYNHSCCSKIILWCYLMYSKCKTLTCCSFINQKIPYCCVWNVHFSPVLVQRKLNFGWSSQNWGQECPWRQCIWVDGLQKTVPIFGHVFLKGEEAE